MKGRPLVKVNARTVNEVKALAEQARQADARAAQQWAATHDTIARLVEARELTIAAAADATGVSVPKLNRALAARRNAETKSG